MTIQRVELVGIVVDDLAAASAFFVELGLKLRARGPSRAIRWTAWWGSGRPGGVAMVETPDGHGHRLCCVRGPEGIIVELAELTG